MKGVVRIRVAQCPDGWRAEVPGVESLGVWKKASRVEAIEALRVKITEKAAAIIADEVLLRLDEPYTEDK